MALGRRKKARQDSETGFSGDAREQERVRLTPAEVQQKVFRLAFRGYNEQDVDQFLDEVTEDLAALHEENKRLREELELRGPGVNTEDARRHAEEIIRRAREEAARITSTAVPSAPAVDVSPATPAFLVREREFLQRLASLVQDHAASLKAEARRAREAAEPEASEPEEPRAEVEDLEEPVETAEPRLDRTAPMAPPGEADAAEWSNPFEGEDRSEPFEQEGSSGEEEPSLRELFWGEE